MGLRLGMMLAGVLCLSLAGCDDLRWQGKTDNDTPPPGEPAGPETDTAPESPEPTLQPAPATDTLRPSSATKTAEIDWEAARRDLASAPERDQSFNIQSGEEAPPVPVLLPTGPVRTASAPDGPQPQFRSLDDGYYAFYPGEDYNLIVNGTNVVTDAETLENADTGEMKFYPTTTGAIVSFSRYGADYLVEFECLGSGEDGGGCVSEDEALSTAEDIVISGTQ